MCIFFLRSVGESCPTTQNIYNVIYVRADALLSRCDDAIGDGSLYDPASKLCKHATVTHLPKGHACEACTAVIQPWKGMSMKEAMLNTIAEIENNTPISETIKENAKVTKMKEAPTTSNTPTDLSSEVKSELASTSSVQKKMPAARAIHNMGHHVEQTRASAGSHEARTSTINAALNPPKSKPQASTMEAATTTAPNRAAPKKSKVPPEARRIRSSLLSVPTKSTQAAPSPTTKREPSRSAPPGPSTGVKKLPGMATFTSTMISQPTPRPMQFNTGPSQYAPQFGCVIQPPHHLTASPYLPSTPYLPPAPAYPTRQIYPNQQATPLQVQQLDSPKRPSDDTTSLRENNKRLRSGMTQLAMERATGARDVAQLLACNERQATRIQELEAEVEGLRGRVDAVEGRRP